MDIKTADRLIEFRKAKGLSQEALAEKLGVSRQAISKWERGESSPDTDNLIALANVYGITLDELLNSQNAQEIISKQKSQDDEKQAEDKKEKKEKKPSIYPELGKALFKFPFWLIVIAMYVISNLVTHLWHPSWLMFLLLPVYYHFAGVCFCKSKKAFLLAQPIPELVIITYLFLGFALSMWAKGAILFFIIPIYYWAVAFYKKSKKE